MKNVNFKNATHANAKTALANVFQLFYSTDEMRPGMLNPFVVGNKTYATDGYTLVSCDNEKIDFEFQNNEKPLNVESVIPEPNTSEIINLDHIDWDSLMLTDETISDGNDVECGNCDGVGTCEETCFYKRKSYNYEYECPVCDGSGYEEESKQIPTGNKTFGSYDLIKFKEAHFYATKFYKIKKVKDLLGGDIELIFYAAFNKPVMVRVGVVEILIMSTINCSDYDVIASIT